MSTKIEVSIGFFSVQIGRKTKRFALLPPLFHQNVQFPDSSLSSLVNTLLESDYGR